MRIVGVTSAIIALSLAAIPVTASGAPNWTAPSTLPFSLQSGPVFGFADGGVQLLGYVESVTPVDPNNAMTRLIVTRTVPGGAPVEELVIASTPTALPLLLDLAVAPSGAAVVVYAEGTSNDFDPSPPPFRWRAVYRSAEGVWEAPTTLFTDSAFSLAFETLCAIAPDGTAVAGAVRVEIDDVPEPPPGQSDSRLDVALRTASGTWQASQRLSPANESATIATLATDDDANFTLAWAARTSEGGTDATSDDVNTFVVRRLLAGQLAWNSRETVSGAGVFVPLLAVGPAGNAVAAFQQGAQAWVATRVDSQHTFTAPEQLITTASSSAPLGAGAAPDGTAYVLYRFSNPVVALSHVGFVKRPPGGDWTPLAPVSPIGLTGRDGAIAFRGDDAIAVWSADESQTLGAPHLIQAARWPAGAAIPEGFRDLEELPEGEFLGQTIADGSDGVLATWSRGMELRAAAYDGGGPELVSATLAATPSAGSSAAFAATFADLWSALAGVPTWDFGDGTPAAAGGTVEHAYAAPGTYNGSVRAADAFGNETVAPFAVTVGPEAIAPGVTITLPACPDTLSAQACERRRRRRRLWQTLRGTVADAAPSSGVAAVEVGVTIVAGKKTLVLDGDRFVRNGDPSARTPATLEGGAWSLRLPKLRAGRCTFTVRARDAAGNVSETALEVKLR